MKDNFDHTLLVAKDDPEINLIKSMHLKTAKIVELDKISCEYFAELTFNFIEKSLSDLDLSLIHI